MKKLLLILFVLIINSCTAFKAVTLIKGGEVSKKNLSTKIQYEKNGHFIQLKVRINNSTKKYNFIVDTAAITSVDIHVAKELNLTGEIKIDIKDTTGAKQKIDLVKISQLNIENIDIHNCACAVFDFNQINQYSKNKIDGIIGSNTLMFFRVTIDYKNNFIVISNNEPSIEEKISNKIKFKKSITSGYAPMISCMIDKHEITGIIDTGFSRNLMLPFDTYEKLKSDKMPLLKGKGIMGGGAISLTNKMYQTRIESYTIGTIEINKVPVSVSENIEKTLIGYDFLSRFKLIIDYPKEELLLIPNGLPFKTNIFTTGLGIKRDEKLKIIICGLWENSAAYKAGLEIGDEILQINRKNVNAMSLFEIMDILENDRINTIEFKIKTNMNIKKIVLVKNYLYQ